MSNTTVELKIPSQGESVTEVEIAEWLKRVGDSVRQDESVLVMESDKATLELPSPVAGRLTNLRKNKGDRAQVGEVIGEIEVGDFAPAPPPVEDKTATKPATKKSESTAPASPPAASATEPPPAVTAATAPNMPATESTLPQEVKPTEPIAEKATPPEPSVSATGFADADRAEEVVPMSLLRRRIAERLVSAQHTAALLTTFNEIDMGAVIALRKENQERFQERYQIKLGFMSFFIKATVAGLKEVPQLNAEIRGTNIVYRNYHDIAIAIGGGRGLVVPVLRNAGRMSFAEVEQGIADFAQRVKANKIKPDELQGGTFTITNGGTYGSLLSTPLVNPPQSGVLGMHAIQERPVAVAGQVVIRPMMYVALTYDHRLVDGREAVQFLKRIKEFIESPARMLIEI
ncbi:MAG TPA: 2-oxoglutarate dehydrogenase complex dihydrolipoyllysine-residue succinyltransferase [Verrucomicrobiota bacterium]|nr:2-oxoglutarate dehydrogenase complex dihydrolipoyllysine-residue succinyltransferase [Verrucomicrobiota bacterium]